MARRSMLKFIIGQVDGSLISLDGGGITVMVVHYPRGVIILWSLVFYCVEKETHRHPGHHNDRRESRDRTTVDTTN